VQVSFESVSDNGYFTCTQIPIYDISLALSLSDLLRMRNVLTNFVEEIKTLILCSKILVKILFFYVTFGECGTDRKVTDINITQHIRISFMIRKATDMHS